MTLGLLIPLVLVVIALTEIPILLMLRQRGSERDQIKWEPVNRFDRATKSVSAQAFPMLILASAALPLLAYLILNVALPDIGTQTLEF